jgi:hypothetical protein
MGEDLFLGCSKSNYFRGERVKKVIARWWYRARRTRPGQRIDLEQAV